MSEPCPEWLRPGWQLRAMSSNPNATPHLVRVSSAGADPDGRLVARVELPETRYTNRNADPVVLFEEVSDGSLQWRGMRLLPPHQEGSAAYLDWLTTQLTGDLARTAARLRVVRREEQLQLLGEIERIGIELLAVMGRTVGEVA